MAAIDRVPWSPAVGHEDEGYPFSLHRQDEGGLGFEAVRDLRAGAEAGIAMLFPRSPDRGCGAEARGVRRPAGAVRGEEPVAAVPLHDRGSFMETSGKDADIATRGS